MNKDQKSINRRDFISSGLKASTAVAVLPVVPVFTQSNKARRKQKLAMVGTGVRGCGSWGQRLLENYNDIIDMVGLCDINLKRAAYAKKYIGANCPVYHADNFDQMINETNPDRVIVTTTDCYHAKYVIRAMELGCDVICEKPLATEAKQCGDILEAEERTGQKVYSTFNARHGNTSEEIKQVLLSGELGKVISVEFQEYLDVKHGASYYRRWHGKMCFSGSLLVHKASHHFDQINWWLGADPEEVHAFGKLAFYGKNNPFRSQKCRGCSFADKCDFYWDITKDEHFMNLYANCEDVDGYIRDGCVWDDAIDTYDSMTVEVKYSNDVMLSYSLNAFMPYEGQRIAFNCEKGRLDIRNYHRQPWDVDCTGEFRLTKSFDKTRTWKVQKGTGGHGGADKKIKDLLFIPGHPDPLGKKAGSRAGVMASLIGIAARTSIQSGQRVKIRDLIDFSY